jgi:lipoprotein-releasing system permease protein
LPVVAAVDNFGPMLSKLPFELLLALRYLRPRRTFVSVITLISILGVMLGVAVLIIVISVMQGFDEQTKERIFAFNAHLRVFADGPMADYREVSERIAEHPEVRGISPIVLGQVLVETQPAAGSSRAFAPYLRGLDPRLEATVSAIPESLIAGSFEVRGRGLLIGVTLAEQLGVWVGDHLAVYSVADWSGWRDAAQAGRDEAPLARDFVIQGIYDVGYNEYNQAFVLMSIGNAQDLYRLEDQVHGLLIKLTDPERADRVRQALRAELGEAYDIRTWFDENRQLLEAILVEKSVMYYLLFFIVLVAAFGITSALITFVVQKTRDIGALKALGASGRQVMALFLSQSLIVGVAGVAAGYGLGMLALAYRNEFLFVMRRFTGFELFPAAVYNFTLLPAVIVPRDVAVICGGSLLICLLAGVVPAWNASRLQPVEALRHE